MTFAQRRNRLTTHFSERIPVVKRHLTMCTYLTYMNRRCYQIIKRVKHFYTNRERCEVLTGYLSLGCRPGGQWANTWHWTVRSTV